MDSFSSTYSVGHAVESGWKFTATFSTANLQCTLHVTLWTMKCTKPQVFQPHVVKRLKVSLKSLVMCFREHLSSAGVWCWTEILFLCMWPGWIPSCLCVRWSHKALFYFWTWQNICINIFKNRLTFTPCQPDHGAAFASIRKRTLIPDSVYHGFKSTQTWYRDTHNPVLPLFKASQTSLRQTGCSHNTRATGLLIGWNSNVYLHMQNKGVYVCVFVCVHPETAKLIWLEAAEVEGDSANNSQHSSDEQSKLTLAFFCHTGWDTDVWEWTSSVLRWLPT